MNRKKEEDNEDDEDNEIMKDTAMDFAESPRSIYLSTDGHDNPVHDYPVHDYPVNDHSKCGSHSW